MKKPAFNELFFSHTYDYLNVFLTRQISRSTNTVEAYTHCLSAFYDYIQKVKQINIMKFTFAACTYEVILSFTQYLHEEKGLSPSSVNQHLATIKGYLSYVADSDISQMQVYLSINRVPYLQVPKKIRTVLGKEELKALLAAPDSSRTGCRDRLILILLFDTAIRAAELRRITLEDISLNCSSPSILIHGKGRKERCVSLNESTVNHLHGYLKMFHPDESDQTASLFYTVINGRKGLMSERNIERIVKKYADIVRRNGIELPETVYPHMLRRSRATGLYRDGVPIEMISVILGHSNSETTRSYAYPSPEQLRKSLKVDERDDEIDKLWDDKIDEMKSKFGLK